MPYRRTERVIAKLAARREELLTAATEIAAERGLAAVQIAPVAERARIAAGTVYRYFPGKADLLAALLTHIQETELAAIRAAADHAPGPLSALAAAVVTFAVGAIERPGLVAAALVPSAEFTPSALQSSFRRAIAAEFAARLRAAIDAGSLAEQHVPTAAAGVLGALAESTIGPLARPAGDVTERRMLVQTAALFVLRGLGIAEARARGLIVQVPAGPTNENFEDKP